jgi:hypothetical protein
MSGHPGRMGDLLSQVFILFFCSNHPALTTKYACDAAIVRAVQNKHDISQMKYEYETVVQQVRQLSRVL